MESKTAGKVTLPPISQVCVVAKDMPAVADFYQSAFGWGPFKVGQGASESKKGDQIYKYKTQVASATLAPVSLEMFTITEGVSPVHSAYLEIGRQGAHHFAVRASEEEKDKIVAAMAKAGVPVAQDRVGRNLFFDAAKTGGVYLEISYMTTAPAPTPTPITGQVKLPAITHVGIMVKDIEAVTELYWSAFGWGPWKITTGKAEAKAEGQTYKYKTKMATAEVAPLTLELFQVTEGVSPVYSTFLDKGWEGIHHFAFANSREQNNQIVAALAKIGVGVVQQSNDSLFLDTARMGGLYIELIEQRSGQK
ncbi:VOC family protein [Chloroflexota bacterium]